MTDDDTRVKYKATTTALTEQSEQRTTDIHGNVSEKQSEKKRIEWAYIYSLQHTTQANKILCWKRKSSINKVSTVVWYFLIVENCIQPFIQFKEISLSVLHKIVIVYARARQLSAFRGYA